MTIAGARTVEVAMMFSHDAGPLGELIGDRDLRGRSLGGRAKAGGRLMTSSADSTVPDLLSIAIAEPAPRVIMAHLRGELDMYSAPELDHVLRLVLIGPLPRRLVLDLTELRFLGSHGVAPLIRLHNQTATAAGPDMLRLPASGRHPGPGPDRSARPVRPARQRRGRPGRREPTGRPAAVASALTAPRPLTMRVTRDLQVHWRSEWFSLPLLHRDGSAQSAAARSIGIYPPCAQNSRHNATSAMNNLLISSLTTKTGRRWWGTGHARWTGT
jgi:anti-anti-sigma factor